MPLDDADDDVGGLGPPLPPDDRLWRHPSELFAVNGPATLPLVDGPAGRDRPWLTATVAGVAGAALATAVLLATGGPWADRAPRDVIERVALSPMVSAPTVRGDRKVIEVAEQVGPSVVRIEPAAGGAAGSAVAFRDDGHLLTSAGLLDGAQNVDLVVGGERVTARLVGDDPATGVAVLKVDPGMLPAAVLGDPTSLQVGEPTVAVWAGASGVPDPVVATGVLSAIGRRVDRPGADPLYGMLQVDVPLQHDSIGGPVLDSRGAVIGIADPTVDLSGQFGFAVPIDVARQVGADIIATGSARHCWLGIEGLDLDDRDALRLGIVGGAVVDGLIAGAPAAEAGLAPGDVIVRVGDRPVRSMDDLVGVLRAHRPGETTTVRYLRDSVSAELTVVLAERP
jgi:S1-C subfamily serine protease